MGDTRDIFIIHLVFFSSEIKMAPIRVDKESVAALSVAELRALCKKLHIKTTKCTKSMMVDTLIAEYRQQQQITAASKLGFGTFRPAARFKAIKPYAVIPARRLENASGHVVLTEGPGQGLVVSASVVVGRLVGQSVIPVVKDDILLCTHLGMYWGIPLNLSLGLTGCDCSTVDPVVQLLAQVDAGETTHNTDTTVEIVSDSEECVID